MVGTHLVMQALRERYAPPAYAFLEQVANGTGSNGSRWSDALAMSLYPSRGLDLIGFEVKVSRTDWQKELAEPAKAEAVAKYCNQWMLVAGDASIVREHELPAPWGLMVFSNGKLRVVKGPKRLEAQPIDRKFLAALLRRVAEWRPGSREINAAVDAAVLAEKTRADANQAVARKAAERRNVEATDHMRHVNSVLGIDVRYVGARELERLRRAADFLRDRETDFKAETMNYVRRLRAAADAIELGAAGIDGGDDEREGDKPAGCAGR